MSRLANLQAEPYRLFFPLGLGLGALGVGHWLFFALGVTEEYRSIFHSMIQIQGFLICFAVGFLFTMLPRRTSSGPPSGLQIAIAALCPVGVAVFSWLERWILAQVFWLILTGLLLQFVASRLGKDAPRRAPVSFLWIPIAIGLGMGGALLTGGAAALGQTYWELHELGRGFVLQGMFLALVMGVGSFAIPLMTGHEPPLDAGASPHDSWWRWFHAIAATALIASFVLETFGSLRGGLALRAVVLWTVLLFGARIWRWPSRPGLIRWLILAAAWCLPIGYTVAASFLTVYKGGLHIAFLGGFALLAFAVSSQVVLGHGGYEKLKEGWPGPLLLMTLALGSAIFGRMMMEVRQEQLQTWMAWAAISFLVAVACWATLNLPRLARR